MSRVAARRYLEHLADAGRVERSPRYGTPGRPETEYVWHRDGLSRSTTHRVVLYRRFIPRQRG